LTEAMRCHAVNKGIM